MIGSMTSDNDDKEAENRARRQRKEGRREERNWRNFGPKRTNEEGRGNGKEIDKRGGKTRASFSAHCGIYDQNRRSKIPIMILQS